MTSEFKIMIYHKANFVHGMAVSDVASFIRLSDFLVEMEINLFDISILIWILLINHLPGEQNKNLIYGPPPILLNVLNFKQ